jgi:hypothetical protein
LATTAIAALRYPGLSDDVNVPEDIQNLATDVDKFVVSRHTSTTNRDAAITAPVAGQACYVDNTTTGLHAAQIYRSSWRNLAEQATFKRKTSVESVTNSSTYQDDNDLTGFSVEANTIYEFRGILFVNTLQAAGFKFRFDFPASSTISVGCHAPAGDAANSTGAYDAYWLATSGAGGDNSCEDSVSPTTDIFTGGLSQATAWTTPQMFMGYLVVGSTAGTLKLQWAQNSSNGTATKVHGGSFMIVSRIG